MSLISRVDLLKLLQDTPEYLVAELGDLLGFGREVQTKTYTMTALGMHRISSELKQQNLNKQPEYNPPIWYLDQYQSRNVSLQEEKPAQASRTEERLDQPKSKPLYSPAQQQLIWDRCLKHDLFFRGIDIPKVVNTLAQAKPIAKLPKQIHESKNQETLIFLDRSHHLTPIWEDQLALAESLQKLLGSELCQVLLMINGISGSMRRLWRSDADDWTQHQLPDAARLLFVTDLAVYSKQGLEQRAWQNWLTRLKNLGHAVTVLTPVSRPDNRFVFEQLSLDGKAAQFNKLKVLMCGCLQSKLPRIRQLRQQVTGGCLEDELRLWNHQQRAQQATGLDWRLAPLDYYQWINADNLTDDEKSRYQEIQRHWRASMPMETEGLEQLIDEVLDQENKKADAALLDPALDLYQQNPAKNTGVFRWLTSQHELLTAFAQHMAEQPKWRRYYQYTQAATQRTESVATDAKGLNETAQLLSIQQIGPELQCCTHSHHPLISGNDFIFDLKQSVYLEKDSMLSAESCRLRTMQSDIELKRISKPSWAQRVWRDHNGIYAAHCENALFFLQPASPQNSRAQWRCLHNPWPWASEAGIDQYGLWADLLIKTAMLRMRWIPPGEFMMGSPVAEKDRENDEQQHRVTLTQGFWLGETSCTQALWQAVMGVNPSDHKDNRQLPVETISWHDCREFLSRLSKKLPGFIAQLPSEAQWEYACRAGTATSYWWGEKFSDHYANNGSGTKLEAAYPANDLGLKSMSGNVLEWCADWNGDYPDSEVTDPFGPEQGQRRVLRGGGWDYRGHNPRSARRLAIEPDSRNHFIGFRLAGGIDPKAGARPYAAHRGPWNGQAMGGVGPGQENNKREDQ